LSLSGGDISFYKVEKPLKPLEQWTNTDFVLNGGIYCMNKEGYHGSISLSKEDYERHIVMEHAGKPAYPGPADIEIYGLKLGSNNMR
jgi:hypothetical protein